MKVPKEFSVAILDYKTDKSVYSFDYNEMNMQKYYKTSNPNMLETNVNITLPFISGLVADKKYYVVFNKYPYALPECDDHERMNPMNKDEWTFTTTSKSFSFISFSPISL